MHEEGKTPWRFINRDGSTNIDIRSFKRESLSDLYHVLLSTSWVNLFFFVLAVYGLINLVFGTLYFLAGEGALEGVRTSSPHDHWTDCFFFSVQTLATIGYGRISPVSISAHLLVTLEALIGLTGLATATGIVFARISRPTARVKFSEKAILTTVSRKPCLMFRMANVRLNQIVEAQVRVVLARTETTEEGHSFRELYDLTLERDLTPVFSMSWTVLHWIDPSSPLFGCSAKSLRESNVELVVTLTGTDETFSQMVHARFSYSADDLVWNAEFEDMISQTQEGKLYISLDRISNIVPSSTSHIGGPVL